MFKMKNGPRLWKSILRQFPEDAIVAGGAVRDYLLGVEPKDIDVFLPSSRWPSEGFKKFSPLDTRGDRDDEYAALGSIDVVQRGRISGYVVDVIGVSSLAWQNAESFVGTFDFGITRSWFDGKLHDTPEAAADRLARRVTLLLHDRPARAATRFARFNERMGGGWAFAQSAEAVAS